MLLFTSLLSKILIDYTLLNSSSKIFIQVGRSKRKIEAEFRPLQLLASQKWIFTILPLLWGWHEGWVWRVARKIPTSNRQLQQKEPDLLYTRIISTFSYPNQKCMNWINICQYMSDKIWYYENIYHWDVWYYLKFW